LEPQRAVELLSEVLLKDLRIVLGFLRVKDILLEIEERLMKQARLMRHLTALLLHASPLVL
jgi:hypothetical protein